MALRSLTVASRALSRRLSTSATASGKGPRLPLGNDPASFHPVEHAINDTRRWKIISMVFGVPVACLFVLQISATHEHSPTPPEYPYLKMATRSPRFPWGEDDLIGTPNDRHDAHGDDHDH